jgi:hypothetical protein
MVGQRHVVAVADELEREREPEREPEQLPASQAAVPEATTYS